MNQVNHATDGQTKETKMTSAELTRIHKTKYSQLGNANSFVAADPKARRVVLGDDGLFWVVSLGDFFRLARAGYQAA